jgi:hypothetical protein
VFFFTASGVSSQENQTAIGLRIAAGGLITAKYHFDDQYALEGILTTRWNGASLHALLERYQKNEQTQNLYWYYGGGLHLGLHGRNNVINPEEGSNDKVYINLGIDLIGGLEYRLPKAPFVIAADYMPSFYFTGNRWLVPEGIGLSIRVVL